MWGFNELIGCLPENSIKSLTLKTNDWGNLKEGLEAQKSIVKMNLSSENEAACPSDLLGDLKLTHLTLNFSNNKGVNELIALQSELVELEIAGMIINNDIFKTISQLPKIEKLTINLSGVSLNVLRSMSGRKLCST